ncbi:MAG: phosphomannomutase/phosphoglucomutase [Megasphaera massiliensis]|uniref:phosphomannomutase/phosphoglucomutase n=1 Tax=Megasphaera massiliensis TaxID=1232428 RepID=UPI002A75E220|nr:phosphomannomutase/phosphoglucomutase [Megasphaera massiliensis]MDY2965338.1 phosphomannomutase/phosphoglucomutase [Megasphaera massiliensis]
MNSTEAILKLQNGSDVRGIAVEGVPDEKVNLTPEAVNRIAAGFAKFLAQKLGKKEGDLRIAVGHDSRISADMMKEAVFAGLLGRGVYVTDCGLASTPAMFMSIIFEDTAMDGSIMITASHLPYNRNGLKFFTKDGGLEKKEVKEVLTLASNLTATAVSTAAIASLDLIERYALHLRQKICAGLCAGMFDRPLEGMHVVVDAGNGSGGFFATKVLAPLGADTTGSQFLEPDGHFPNHIPNPENKEAMASIRKAVLDNKADLGLIFDTDVDRMSAVLPSGEEINRNALIAMMAAILAPDYPGSTIITDSVTSDELTTFLQDELHLVHHRYMRGYKNVIDECIRLNEAGTVSPLAIETSGHGALSENYYLDDGAYLAVKLLMAAAKAKKAGKPLGDLIKALGQPAEGVEYRLKISGDGDVQAYGADVLKAFEQRAEEKGITIAKPSYEGVRLVFEGGWALLRMSLHDPNMPLNIESKEVGGCEAIAKDVKGLLSGFDRLNITVLPE